MNPCAYIFVLVVAINPLIYARSINFGNFFFDDSGSKTSSTVPPSQSSTSLDIGRAEELHLNTSEDGIDPKIFIASSEQRDQEPESFNASAAGLDIGKLNDSDSVRTLSNNVSFGLSRNDSQTKTSLASSSTMASALANGRTSSEGHSTVLFHAHSSNKSLDSTTSEEMEDVVLGTMRATIIPIPKTIYQKSLEWMESAYTLSILIPVAAGVLFATTVIILIALCRCMRRCCRRRRFRQKCLPDSVKSLRPADRARLLGESSDDEF